MKKKINKEELEQAAFKVGISTFQADELWLLIDRKTISENRFDIFNVLYYLGSMIILYAMIDLGKIGYIAN